MGCDLLPTPEEQANALNSAIRNGNLDEVKNLVDVKHYKGVGFPLLQSAFNTAMASGNVEIARFLSDHGHRDDGMTLYNAISSRSLSMFRYAIDNLSLKFESRFFKHALGLDWIVDQDGDAIRAVLDQANECGFLDWSNSNGVSGCTDDIGGDDALLQSIHIFTGKIIGTDIFPYVLEILDDNYSNEILFETGYYGEKDYIYLLKIAIEKNDIKSFKAIWERVHRLAFNSAEKEEFDNWNGARTLANQLFELAADIGRKDFFEYLSIFVDPDYKALFFRQRDTSQPEQS